MEAIGLTWDEQQDDLAPEVIELAKRIADERDQRG